MYFFSYVTEVRLLCLGVGDCYIMVFAVHIIISRSHRLQRLFQSLFFCHPLQKLPGALGNNLLKGRITITCCSGGASDNSLNNKSDQWGPYFFVF